MFIWWIQTVKIVQVVGILIIAALFVYRGNTFNDPQATSMVPALMCAAFATFLVLTAITMAFRDEAEMA